MWQEWMAREPVLFGTAVGHLGLLVLLLVVAGLDRTVVTGVNRWVKPMKFCASIAIYLGSMAWFWPLAVASEGAKRAAALVLAGTLILEMVWIVVQAARGVRSHFNVTTALDGLAFQMAGLVIVVNVATAALVGWWTMGTEGTAYVWGVRLGVLSFVVFAMEGAVMAQRLGHAVGAPDEGPGLPVVNWSTKGGDLRVAHFVGMHALQVLPVLGFLTESVAAVAGAFAVWVGISAGVMVQALRGRPLVKG